MENRKNLVQFARISKVFSIKCHRLYMFYIVMKVWRRQKKKNMVLPVRYIYKIYYKHMPYVSWEIYLLLVWSLILEPLIGMKSGEWKKKKDVNLKNVEVWCCDNARTHRHKPIHVIDSATQDDCCVFCCCCCCCCFSSVDLSLIPLIFILVNFIRSSASTNVAVLVRVPYHYPIIFRRPD